LAPNLRNLKNLRKTDDIKKNYNFSKENVLGSGSFGKVYKATNKQFKTEVALKKVSKSALRKNPMLKNLML